MFLGTPVYMAPELLGGQPADARTDLYALGVLVYELLAGRPPFEAPSMGALLRAVMRSSPPALATLRRDWTPALGARFDALLEPLLTKQAERRQADGQQFAAAARALAQTLPALPRLHS
jgi:serine/threonine protein kinase